MQYLVQMRLANPSRPTTADDGLAFIEQYILPTLERCEGLQSHNKIIAGGPVSGAVALALIVDADTGRALDEVLTSIPVWPLMETTVTPLTMFNDRRQAVLSVRERLAIQSRERAEATR